MSDVTIYPESRRKSLEDLKVILSKLKDIDVGRLGRADELSRTINFNEALPYLELLLDPFRTLADRGLDRLTTPQIQRVVNAATQVESYVAKIREYRINQSNPEDVCNSIITEIKNSYDAIMEPLLLSLTFTSIQATDYARLEREALGVKTKMERDAERFTQQMEVSKSEAEKSLAAVRKVAAESGVASNATIFEEDAKAHAKQAARWFIASVCAGIITFTVACAGVYAAFVYNPTTAQAAIQYVVAKVILLSVLSFIFVWCSRNYKAHRHNQTLIQHRANALKTFQAFVEGTSDRAVKDAILLHAAQAAFVPRPTAFDSNEGEQQPINPVVEIFGRALTKGATG